MERFLGLFTDAYQTAKTTAEVQLGQAILSSPKKKSWLVVGKSDAAVAKIPWTGERLRVLKAICHYERTHECAAALSEGTLLAQMKIQFRNSCDSGGNY